MLTRLVVIIILAWMVYIWFEWWVVHTINHDIDRKEENYKELVEWWKKQTHNVLAEVNEWKDKRSEMQHMYNKERNKVFELEQKIDWNSGRYLKKNDKTKKTELEENKDLVIKCYKQWMTMKWIAEKFKCSPATVKRALKRWNVTRRCRSRS